jgi:hypothetical protein
MTRVAFAAEEERKEGRQHVEQSTVIVGQFLQSRSRPFA